VEILLSLLILGLGLMGVLVLFPMGIDAARVSTETTRAATIARQAEAELFCVNGSDQRSPFQRIVARARSTTSPERVWFLPNFDEVLYPEPTDGDAACQGDPDALNNGPQVRRTSAGGAGSPSGEYSWSITVAYPYDADGANPDYLLNGLWQNDKVFIVQVTVYRGFNAVAGQGKFAHNSIVVDSLNLTGAPLESVRGGDWVRFLDTTTAPWSGDGFWYRVDQVDAPRQRVKLGGQYWGREGTGVPPLEFTDRVVGTYTFLLSAD
jgi:type II secretory pathway pseudopilin PulG